MVYRREANGMERHDKFTGTSKGLLSRLVDRKFYMVVRVSANREVCKWDKDAIPKVKCRGMRGVVERTNKRGGK